MKVLFLLGVFGGMCLSFCQTDEKSPSVYDQGMEIIKKEGVDAGIKFFEDHAIETGSYKSLFGMAWGYWVDGKLDQAKKICDFILQKKPSEVLEAHCHYLLGHVSIILEEYKQAHVSFVLALTVYQKLERFGDVFKTYLGLAAAQILGKDYENAEEYLQQALAANELAGKNTGHFWHLKARAAFGRGLYDQALEFSRHSYDEYRANEDIENYSNELSEIGLYLILTGELKEGLEKTHEASQLITENGFKKLSYYNAVNLILAYRCSGLDYMEIEENVRLWIETQKDFFLKSHLEFALNYQCH